MRLHLGELVRDIETSPLALAHTRLACGVESVPPERLCSGGFLVRSPLPWELRTRRLGRKLDVHVVVADWRHCSLGGVPDAWRCRRVRVAF